MTKQIVLIGGGQASAQAIVSLHQSDADVSVHLIGREPEIPYQRPPLSKAYLKSEITEERLYLRPVEYYSKDNANVSLKLSQSAIEIDRKAKLVTVEDGNRIPYDELLIATGAPPRRLNVPGNELNGIYYLRSMADSEALRSILGEKTPVIIVGAGYIGLEVAAVACAAGCRVIVVELAERVLSRVASPVVSGFFEDLHKAAGVEFIFGAAAERFLGDGHVEAVELSDGQVLKCGSVLVGIGAVPETELAERAGINVENGITVDAHMRTSDPNIWAAGDCVNFPCVQTRTRLRLESVPNAIEQAKVAAANMIGGNVSYDAVPWFWSDQFDTKLQTVGLMHEHEDEVLLGDREQGQFSVWYFKEDILIAVDAINSPQAFAVAKRLLSSGQAISTQQLNDAPDLKALMKLAK